LVQIIGVEGRDFNEGEGSGGEVSLILFFFLISKVLIIREYKGYSIPYKK
jgi:hypothetical protein